MTQSESFANSLYADQTHLAERELSAFIAAVAELFGADQARMLAEDWLDESGLMDVSPRSTPRDWRAITIAASVRLANRLNVALLSEVTRRIDNWYPGIANNRVVNNIGLRPSRGK
jgi:hypothetical protein